MLECHLSLLLAVIKLDVVVVDPIYRREQRCRRVAHIAHHSFVSIISAWQSTMLCCVYYDYMHSCSCRVVQIGCTVCLCGDVPPSVSRTPTTANDVGGAVRAKLFKLERAMPKKTERVSEPSHI